MEGIRSGNALPDSVRNGLREVLLGAAALTPAHSFAVLTTSPQDWLLGATDQALAIIDVSAIFGTSAWRTGKDLEGFVLSRLMQLGWSHSNLRQGQRLEVSPRFFPDITLCNDDGEPLAFIDVKASLRDERIQQVYAHYRTIAARWPRVGIYVTDGRGVLRLQTNAEPIDVDGLPTPESFGLTPGTSAESGLAFTSQLGVTYPTNFDELLSALAFQPDPVFLVDHTLPWGDRSPSIEQMAEQLPRSIRTKLGRVDSALAFLLSTVTAAGAARGLVALVLRAFLSSSRYELIRKHLQDAFPLRGIVSLPDRLLTPLTMIPSALIAMGDFGTTSRDVIFIPVSNPGELISPRTQLWWTSFVSGIQGEKTNLGFRACVSSPESWEPERHSPAIAAIEAQLRAISEVKLLGEVCDIMPGMVTRLKEASRGKGHSVIRGRDLSEGGVLNAEKLDKFDVDAASLRRSPRIMSGDVLLQRIGSSPTAAVAGPDLSEALLSSNVLLLRPKNTGINAASLVSFLSSSIGQQLLASTAAGVQIRTLSVRTLKSIPVPLLTDEVVSELDSLKILEQELRAQAAKIEAMRLNLFAADSKQALADSLKSVKQLSRSLSNSMNQAEDLDFQIRNLYPFPLAFGYRQLSSLTTPQDVYRELLRLVENVLAFLGSLSLAMGLATKARIQLDLVDSWRSGISPGHWRQICQHVADAIRDKGDFAQSLSQLWQERRAPRFDKAIDDLIVAKNNFKHDRGPAIDQEFAAECKTLRETIELGMRKLGFLTNYNLQYVVDVNGIRNSPRIQVRTLAMIGDHPAWPQKTFEHLGFLTKGDVFLPLTSNDWCSLYPFLVVETCRQCKARESYFIDGVDFRRKIAFLKSFERGHSMESSEIGAQLISSIPDIAQPPQKD